MIDMDIIELLELFYVSLIVVVKKFDGSKRICVDFCNLNKVIIFDFELMLDFDEIMIKISNSCFFFKFDLCKGYW